ncbi:MAG: hypothetical protein IH830_07290 [Planctomycetes bacterium]|nr:hypothetical protein [Planctomycetota bacterium]
MIRAIGVLILALSLPDVIHGVVYLFYRVTSAETFLGGTLISVISLRGPLIGCALGLYLFFGGKWVVNLCIPSNRPYCPECGYDLSKATSANCPECGVKLPRDSSTG